MAKGYWVSCYRAVHDQTKLDAYAKLAGPAIQKHGGRFVVRGVAAEAHEQGVVGRTVVVEFDSVEAARTARNSPEYGEALDALHGAVERDFRICEGAG
jgi:uncharacterized protein (DUF1330 family)